MPDWLHHILSGGRILLKNTFEAYMDSYIQHKLEMILQEHRVVSLVTMLRGTVCVGLSPCVCLCVRSLVYVPSVTHPILLTFSPNPSYFLPKAQPKFKSSISIVHVH
jgi:hypothetical protein